LHGLARSLRMLRREEDANAAEKRFRQAWSHADHDFSPSRFEPFLVFKHDE
jgi:hypothetical protein